MVLTDNGPNFINYYSRVSGPGRSVSFNFESDEYEESICFSYETDTDQGDFFDCDKKNDCNCDSLFGCSDECSDETCNAKSDIWGGGRLGGFMQDLFGGINNMLGSISGPVQCQNSLNGGGSRQKSGQTQEKQNVESGGAAQGGAAGQGAQGAIKGVDNYIKGGGGKPQTYNVGGLGKNKQKIVAAAKNSGADDKTIAALLAIANQETQKMDTNYNHGDGKGGDSACFTPFKCNASMIKEAAEDGAIDKKYINDPASINNNLEDGVKVMTSLMKKYGMKKFIDYLRGGTSGRDGNYPRSKIDDYDQAMQKLISAYANNKDLWTNDERVKSDVKAI